MTNLRVTLDSVVARAERLRDMQVHGERVLIDVASEKYIGLDEVGAAIYDALGKPRLVRDLLAELAAEYDDPGSQMAGDLLEFLDRELAAKRILPAGGGAGS